MKAKRTVQVLALPDPLVPKYIFEAHIQCEPSTHERKDQLLSTLDASLSASPWERNGIVFTQLIDVETGDLGAAENEFISAVRACAETHLEPAELHILRITFNSSTVSLIDAPPPPIVAPVAPWIEPEPEPEPEPTPVELPPSTFDPVTGLWS